MSRCLLTAVISALALQACAPPTARPSASPAAPSPAPSATRPIVTPTPTLATNQLHPVLFQRSSGGPWVMIGLVENRSDHILSDVLIQARLYDVSGDLIVLKTTSPTLSSLPPSQASPYLVIFENLETRPGRAEVEVLKYAADGLPAPRLDFAEVNRLPRPRGGFVLLGSLANPGDQPVIVQKLVTLVTDAGGTPLGLLPPSSYPGYLQPGGSSVYAFEVPLEDADIALETFAEASFAETPLAPPITLPEPARRVHDSQGNVFVLGEVSNPASTPMMATLRIFLDAGGTHLAAVDLEWPIPLAPKARHAFSATEFPGLGALIAAGDIQVEEIEVEVSVDAFRSGPASSSPVRLGVLVEAFEQIGSSVFLHGRVDNEGDSSVFNASVLAAIRSTQGELWSAGWTSVDGPLASGESRAFTLPMRLVAHASMLDAEYDITAWGTLR